MSETWTVAAFRIEVGHPGATRAQDLDTGTRTVNGETWGPFGITAEHGRGWTSWRVTHLPTGRLMAILDTKPMARQFCREVAPLTDWSAVRPGPIPSEIKDAFLAIYRRVRDIQADPVEVLP